MFTGFRVQHNGARGPYKGGIRYHPEVDLDEVRALAHADDAGRPRSPASRSAAPRAASTSTPRARPTTSCEQITRSFIDKIEKVLGPTRDIPAPDVGTNAQVMAWMMDEYGKLHGHTPAIVTGKPIALEGSLRPRGGDRPRRRLHVPRGGAELGLEPDGTRVVVQGFGNVGSLGRAVIARARAARSSACPTRTARSAPTRASTPRRCRARRATAGKLAEFEADGGEAIEPEELLAHRVRRASSPRRSAA